VSLPQNTNLRLAAPGGATRTMIMGKKLYVGNLGYDVTQKDLEGLFAQAGTCESASVITDRTTGQSRGFGFVEMSSNAEAQSAIEQFNGREFRGRALKVNEAAERNDRRGGGNRDQRPRRY
jgi:RNA recognition motif-containing protein